MWAHTGIHLHIMNMLIVRQCKGGARGINGAGCASRTVERVMCAHRKVSSLALAVAQALGLNKGRSLVHCLAHNYPHSPFTASIPAPRVLVPRILSIAYIGGFATTPSCSRAFVRFLGSFLKSIPPNPHFRSLHGARVARVAVTNDPHQASLKRRTSKRCCSTRQLLTLRQLQFPQLLPAKLARQSLQTFTEYYFFRRVSISNIQISIQFLLFIQKIWCIDRQQSNFHLVYSVTH